jgi:hypothetical protein
MVITVGTDSTNRKKTPQKLLYGILENTRIIESGYKSVAVILSKIGAKTLSAAKLFPLNMM